MAERQLPIPCGGAAKGIDARHTTPLEALPATRKAHRLCWTKALVQQRGRRLEKGQQAIRRDTHTRINLPDATLMIRQSSTHETLH